MQTDTHYPKGFRLFLFVFSLLALTVAPDLSSQTYFFDNYNTQHGFESKVFAIIQDKNHYAWLGTPSGVSEFDGKTFVSYTKDKGLAEGSVRVLFIDHKNVLWLGHEGGGVSRRDGKVFEKISFMDSLIRSNITSIIQDKDNQLWITTESDGALMIKNPNDRVAFLEYEHYLKGESLGDQVFGSLRTSDGSLFFITNAGIRKYNKAGNSFEKYLPEGLSTYFLITVMFEDSRGDLWFGMHQGGLSKMDHRDKSFRYYDTDDGLASNWITSIIEDREGNIWTGHWKGEFSSGGISRIDPKGTIKVFNTSNGLHDDHIWCIRQDHEGNMLIGTTDQGLEIYKGERFLSFTTKDGMVHNLVSAVIEGPQGQIWFGTRQEGISVYTENDRDSPFHHFNQTNSNISNRIRFFKKDASNNIWIGTEDQGVWLYNTARKRFEEQSRINQWIPLQSISNGISALELGKDGHLWIGTLNGLVEYDIIKDSYVATYTQGAGLAGNDIMALFADSKGDLWIGAGSNKGLTRLHNGVFTIIRNIGEVTPTCLAEDRYGKLWIGTETNGVMVLDNDSIRSYAAEDGLLSDRINLLYCDVHDNIFVGTNLGLNQIDQRNKKILSYTKALGFTGIETKPNAWCMDSKGYLWLGTANGAIRCDLKLLTQEDTIKPVIRIHEMLVKGIATDMVRGRRFSSSQSDMTFKYSSISFTNPDGIMYETMLEGYDETWRNQKNENTIVFNKIPPGRYTFKVRARNEFGEWTATPASYSFRILPPPYKRGYFIISVLVIILASIIAYIKIREKNLVQEKKILEERVEERTRALSEVNEQLSMRNRDITDSITYAKRIQFAILPPDIPFDNTFILFKPKDIVSGDFYWINSAGGREFLAAVDCTGHGVPGAFMSFIGYTSLNKIIIEQGIYKPSDILDRLNAEVATTLHQKGEVIVNDGMDIALICYCPETGKLEYAGAFNPLIVIRKQEIIEIKADRFAIGRTAGKENAFTNHEFQLEKGDMMYLYSDGYADQFGGPDGKKFKTSTLKELFKTISHYNVDRQQKTLDTSFEDWKAGQGQIDDVLIMGRKF